MKTIDDLYKILTADGGKFISCLGETKFYSKEWSIAYRTDNTMIDPLVLSLFSGLELDDLIITDCEIDPLVAKMLMRAEMIANIYKYDKIWDALQLEYNPIWNVDGTETTVYGERNKTMNEGAREETDSNGSRTDTTNYGSRQHTTEHDDDITTNKTAADNSDVYSNNTETSVDYGAITETDAVVTDTVSHDAYTDKHTKKAATDTEKESQHTDVVTRQGNIGVTSTQNLLTQEYEIAKASFFKMLIADAVKSVTIPTYL